MSRLRETQMSMTAQPDSLADLRPEPSMQQCQVDDAITEALRNETRLPTPKLEALHEFPLRVIRDRGFVDESDTQAFLDAGFTQANILEVILGAAQKLMSNYTNHFAQTPIDPVFDKFAWEKAAAAAN